MKVKELIAELQQLDPDVEVVMSKDGEGNGFSPYAGYGTGYYLPENTWSGEFYSEYVDEEDEEELEILEEVKNDERTVYAVSLWPVN